MARIGVNALYLIPGGVGGTEIYLRELLAALARIDRANDYFIFTNQETVDLVPKQANFHWKPQAVRARFRPARILWEQMVLPLEIARHRLDVFFNPGFTSPLFAPCRCVTVFHDLQHKRRPEYFRRLDLPFWNLLLWIAARRSQRLIAVSEATRGDLIQFYPFASEKIHVVHHGVDPAFLALDRSVIEPYILCVSTLHPHKNLDRLIRAWGRRKRDEKLIIAGMRGFHADAIERVIGEHGLRDEVRLTGWIPRKELLGLYERARGFIYPSTFEGFGMPVLEAMAAGLPVACSDIPPLREIGGDTLAYFDPLSDDAIAEALDQLSTRNVDRAKARAHEFTWEESANLTLEALASGPRLSQ